MRRYRVGLALTFDPEQRAFINGLRLAIGGFGVGRIEPHVTLTPPSNIRYDDIFAEIYRLRKISSQVSPFELVVGPSGSFDPVAPVLYLAVAGEEVSKTEELVDSITTSGIYRRDPRPYVPHVTLADGISHEKIEAALKLLDSELFRLRVDSVQMMLSKSQAYWEVFSDFRFVKARKLHRGGLQIEVFPHRSGDLAIYQMAEDLGVSQSNFWACSDPRLRLGDQKFYQVSLYYDGELIGCGSAAYSSVFALVRSVVVRREFQRLGIGSLVLEELRYGLQLLGVEVLYACANLEMEGFILKSGASKSPDSPQFLHYENGMTLNSWSFSRR